MVCKVCGRSTGNENANFCEYCGSSYKDASIVNTQMVENQTEKAQYNQQQDERASQQQQSGQQRYNQQQYNQQYYSNQSLMKEDKQSISFKHWLGMLFLPCIPFIGPFVNFVMLIIWGFGRGTGETKKNFARAALVVNIVVSVVFFIIYAIILGSVFSELSSGGFNANDYLNNFY